MNAQFSPGGAQSFASNDVAEVEAFVSAIYSKMQIGAVGERTHARIARRVLGPDVAFDDLDYSFDIGYAAEPPPLLIICDVVSSTIEAHNGDAVDSFGPGEQFLISRPGIPYGGLAHATKLRFTLINPGLLNSVVATQNTELRRSLRVLDHRPVSAAAAAQLQRSIAYVRDEVMASNQETVTSAPLLITTASQFLAASVLHAYPNTAVVPAPREQRDATPTTVHRAIAFIEANPDLGLTLAEIAGAAFVSPRALQMAFRRHLDTTPMAYLRRVRLDHARQQLRAAHSGDGTTVTAIAARWGFTSNRFTQQYRTTYGESPSQTLFR